ncbi:MAG: NAD-dependent epimerase/dehydratase family protein [Actinobacteria bacterium]|nr:NAD-dependent epimerase/dehydratase family protein [Actinomycetota bacterium]
MSNAWQDRRVFITGATGLLGSSLTAELVEKGASVVALVRDKLPGSELIRSGLIHKIDRVDGELEDYPTVQRTINEYEIDTIFHLGAQTIVPTANRNPLSTFEANIRGTWHVLEAARHTSTVKAVVVASSDKAYGSQEVLPYDESMPLQGRFPYDVSKSCADLLAQSYAHSYSLPVAVTRCGNFYGGGDLNFNRIVPGVIRWAYRGQRPIIRSDGKMIRDYFYVRDGACCYIELAQYLHSHPEIAGEAFNFSNEQQISVLELTELLLKLMDKSDLKPQVLSQANNEIPHQYLSAAKAHKILGWQPRWSLEDGLKETIAWYEEYFKSFQTTDAG